MRGNGVPSRIHLARTQLARAATPRATAPPPADPVTHPASPPVPSPDAGAPPFAGLALLRDGALTLHVHRAVAGMADGWIPLGAAAARAPGAARIRLVPGRARPFPLPDGEPAVQVLGVDGWIDPAAARVRLASRDGALWGSVDLARLRAVVAVRRPGPPPGLDLTAALTVCAALLLGRLGRALLHAAAVVAPDLRAWLLVGDSHAGKTSTCVNLIRAGWDWLADDQVVVRASGDGVEVEGWPRRFTLDDGFEAGASRGTRTPADPARFGPGRLRPAAPLAGLLLPRVRPDQPTHLSPAHPADGLGQLIRQSPWLLADAHAAPRVLSLLQRMAKTSVYRAGLGTDTYADPALLQLRVAEALYSGERKF